MAQAAATAQQLHTNRQKRFLRKAGRAARGRLRWIEDGIEDAYKFGRWGAAIRFAGSRR